MSAFDVVLVIVSGCALIWALWNERRLDRIEGSLYELIEALTKVPSERN